MIFFQILLGCILIVIILFVILMIRTMIFSAKAKKAPDLSYCTITSKSTCYNSIAFLQDGQHILAGVGTLETKIEYWDLTSVSCIRTLTGQGWGHTRSIVSLTVSPDGKYVLSGSEDKTIKLWDIFSDICLYTLVGHTGYVNSVVASKDFRYVLSGSHDKTIKYWDLSEGNCIHTFTGHTDHVSFVAMSPDDQYALSASDDYTIKYWDLSTGTCIKTLKGHGRNVTCVTFSPDGQHALSSSGDATIKYWDLSTGTCIWTGKEHKAPVYSVAISPDGQYALSGSYDCTIKYWKLSSGECIQTLTGHHLYVYSVIFSPDGEHALSASTDKTIKYWKLQTNNREAILRETFPSQTEQILWLHQRQPSQDLTAREKQLIVEADDLIKLSISNPTEAYSHAVVNLQYAQQTGNATTIMLSAFAFAQIAERYSKLEEAVGAYNLASDSASIVKNKRVYANAQERLGSLYSYISKQTETQDGYLWRDAIECYNNALRVYTEQEFPEEWARTYYNLGIAYSELRTADQAEKFANAIICYEKALRVYTEERFPRQYIQIQHNLGNARSQLPTGDPNENHEDAITCYKNALRVCAKHNFQQEYTLTQAHLGIAYTHRMFGNRIENLQEAIRCFEDALHVGGDQISPLHYVTIQKGLGDVYTELPVEEDRTNIKKALTYYENALKVCADQNVPSYHTASIYLSLGNTYKTFLTDELESNLKNAIDQYESALQIFTLKEFPKEHASTLYSLAITYALPPLNDWQKAYDMCDSSIQIWETQILMKSSFETRFSITRELAKMCTFMVSVCIHLNRIDEALGYANFCKSPTLTEMFYNQIFPVENILKERSGFTKSTSPLTVEKIKELVPENTLFIECLMAHNETYVFVLDKSTDVKDTYLVLKDFTAKEGRRLAIEKWFLPYSQTRDIHTVLSKIKYYLSVISGETKTKEEFTELKAKILNSIRIFRDYSVDARKVFQNDLQKWWIKLEDGFLSELHQIEDAIENDRLDEIPEILERVGPILRRFEQEWYDAIETISDFLADKLWYAEDETGKSVAKLVKKNVERIVFIPHFWLRLLPLHLISLKSHENPESLPKLRLIDKYEIAYIPSISVLKFLLQRDRDDLTRLFSVVNPDRTLRFADAEMHGISEIYRTYELSHTPTILRHEQATKEAILLLVPQANILHFICHSRHQGDNALFSRLLLSTGKDEEYFEMGDIVPFSHLSKDLTLYDIFADLKLPNAAAVILSACETGMVKLEEGDECIGLPGAFMYAGAPTVISSLWAVDDLSTALLMSRWYESVLQAKTDKATALREAQLWVRDLTNKDLFDYLNHSPMGQHIDSEIVNGYKRSALLNPNYKPFEHPYYWGAFICYGNWK